MASFSNFALQLPSICANSCMFICVAFVLILPQSQSEIDSLETTLDIYTPIMVCSGCESSFTLWFNATIYKSEIDRKNDEGTYTANIGSRLQVIGHSTCLTTFEAKLMLTNTYMGTTISMASVKITTTSGVWYQIDSFLDSNADEQLSLCVGSSGCAPSRQIVYFDASKPNTAITKAGWSDGSGISTKPITCDPTSYPTTYPTSYPTSYPSYPTSDPTSDPTSHPTSDPTSHPTSNPTLYPLTLYRTEPTFKPTLEPTTKEVKSKLTPTITAAENSTADPINSAEGEAHDNTDSQNEYVGDNPDTADRYLLWIILGVGSLCIIVSCGICIYRRNYNKQKLQNKDVKKIRNSIDGDNKHVISQPQDHIYANDNNHAVTAKNIDLLCELQTAVTANYNENEGKMHIQNIEQIERIDEDDDDLYNQGPIDIGTTKGTNTGGHTITGKTFGGTNNVNMRKCVDCERIKKGKVHEGDGLFYCNECWSYYEDDIVPKGEVQ